MTTRSAGQPTIVDVAEHAGVSKSAVSRVLSGTGRYSDATRDRVLQAAADLGYVANAMARGLVRGRTHTIGMLVRDASSLLYTGLHVVMERRASELGYRLVTTTGVGRVEDEKAALAALVSMRVDGLVVCSGLLPAEDIAEFTPRIATVVAGRPEMHPALSSVFCDEVDGGAAMADVVADAGHRSAAVLVVPREDAITQHARCRAMSDRLRARGVDVVEIDGRFARSPREIAADVRAAMGPLAGVRSGGVQGVPGAADPATGLQADAGGGVPAARGAAGATTGLQAGPVTAFLCPSDRVMLDVSGALAEVGVRVPEDLSATGFDGVFPMDSSWIGVTTLQQPVEEIGRTAIDMLVARIDDPDVVVEHRALRGRVLPGRTVRAR